MHLTDIESSATYNAIGWLTKTSTCFRFSYHHPCWIIIIVAKPKPVLNAARSSMMKCWILNHVWGPPFFDHNWIIYVLISTHSWRQLWYMIRLKYTLKKNLIMMSTNLYFQMNKWTTIGMEVHLSADDVSFTEGCMKEQHNNNSNNLKMNNI